MALVSVHRGSRGLPLYFIGTQTGAFDLGSGTPDGGYVVFELDPALYTSRGSYVLVSYPVDGLSYDSARFATPQAAVAELVSVTAVGTGRVVGPIKLDTANRRITVDLL